MNSSRQFNSLLVSVVDAAIASRGDVCGLDAVETLLSLLSLMAGEVGSGRELSVPCVVDFCESMARINILSSLLLLGEHQLCSSRSKSLSSLP